MGDFNIPNLNWSAMQYTTKASEALLGMMLNFNFWQIVKCPTKVQRVLEYTPPDLAN